MKIAIASSGKEMESKVDPRFGRCPYFLIVDPEKDDFQVLDNNAGKAFRGAGISAAQMIVDKGVQAVIAGNFGPKAVSVLNSGNLKIYSVAGMTIKQAVVKYKEGKLEEVKGSGFTGRGFGRGRW